MTTSHDVAAYFAKFPHCSNIKPVVLTINGMAYPAAIYDTTTKLDPSMPAYQRGEREHTDTRIYAVGMLPRVYCNNSRIAFRMPGDARDWYVAAYFGDLKYHKQAVASVSEFHPFGNDFILCCWDVPGNIDQYEFNTRKRIAVSVVEG